MFIMKHNLFVAIIILTFSVLMYKYYFVLDDYMILKDNCDSVSNQFDGQINSLKEDIVWARELENDIRVKCLNDVELIDTLGNCYSAFEILSADNPIYRVLKMHVNLVLYQPLNLLINKVNR